MASGLKVGLTSRLREVGAFDVKIADPRRGYEHALPGRHPLQLWAACRSVVVFPVASSPQMNNTYVGPYAPWPQKNRGLGPLPEDIQSRDYAMERLNRLLFSAITLAGVDDMLARGVQVSLKKPQCKLSAVEAGLSVYGRSGITLHPVLGNRFRIGILMTGAVMEPDQPLFDYHPCEGCDICIQACPAKAFDPQKSYPHSYDRAACAARRARIAEAGSYCHNCFAPCSAGTISDDRLMSMQETVNFWKPTRGAGGLPRTARRWPRQPG